MKWIRNIMMLSCKKATTLIEKKSIESLSIIENIQLKLHLQMCSSCENYYDDSKAIDHELSHHYSGSEIIDSGKLSAKTKTSIMDKIKDS